MEFYFMTNLKKQKLKLLNAKYFFCNGDADVNADADANISKWSCETTVTTKILAQEIESENYSQNILSLLNSHVCFL